MYSPNYRLLLSIVYIVLSIIIGINCEFKMTLLHTNDMHARVLETSRTTGVCNPPGPCYGGFARLRTKVNQLKSTIKNTLVLNAGDTYQGTPMYTMFKWRVLVPLMNMLNIDVMTLGNHEFDDGIAGLTPFLQQIRIPVVVSNLDTTGEPSLVNHTALKPWVMVKVENVKIAVIGYLAQETKVVSSTGNLIILDEIEMLKKYSKEAKQGGANLIFVLGHSGYDKDLEIAKKVPEIDVVVGGHSHSFLYTGTPPDIDKPLNVYPVMVQQDSGKKVPVVQAFENTKYLGKLDLVWNDKFELLSAIGNPILLDSSVPKDKKMEDAINVWKAKLSDTFQERRGGSRVFLDGKCRQSECNLGNLITDAFVDFAVSQSSVPDWTDTPIAILNGGAIRNSVPRSDRITWGDLMTVFPFINLLVRVHMKGSTLMKAIERNVENYDLATGVGRGEFLQLSGIKVEYEENDNGKLVVKKVLTRCGNCPVPRYEELDLKKEYSVITTTYVASGGNAYAMIRDEAIKQHTFHQSDLSALADYLGKTSPVYIGEEGRIVIKRRKS